MDARNLIELLEATTNPDPTNIAQAEERLSQVKKNWEYCHVLWDLSALLVEKWCENDCRNDWLWCECDNLHNYQIWYIVHSSKSNVLHDFCSRHTILIWVCSVCVGMFPRIFFLFFLLNLTWPKIIIKFHCSGSVWLWNVCNDKIEMFL